MYEYFALYVCWCTCVLVPTEDGRGSPGNGATDGCEPPHRCLELNLDPLEEQPVFFTAEPSLQHHPPTSIWLLTWVLGAELRLSCVFKAESFLQLTGLSLACKIEMLNNSLCPFLMVPGNSTFCLPEYGHAGSLTELECYNV